MGPANNLPLRTQFLQLPDSQIGRKLSSPSTSSRTCPCVFRLREAIWTQQRFERGEGQDSSTLWTGVTTVPVCKFSDGAQLATVLRTCSEERKEKRYMRHSSSWCLGCWNVSVDCYRKHPQRPIGPGRISRIPLRSGGTDGLDAEDTGQPCSFFAVVFVPLM